MHIQNIYIYMYAYAAYVRTYGCAVVHMHTIYCITECNTYRITCMHRSNVRRLKCGFTQQKWNIISQLYSNSARGSRVGRNIRVRSIINTLTPPG